MGGWGQFRSVIGQDAVSIKNSGKTGERRAVERFLKRFGASDPLAQAFHILGQFFFSNPMIPSWPCRSKSTSIEVVMVA